MGICLITTRLCRFTTLHSSLSAHLPHYLSKNYFVVCLAIRLCLFDVFCALLGHEKIV